MRTKKQKQTAPVVGMGVTCIVGSDRMPCTVVAVISKKRCIIRHDRAKRVDADIWDPCAEQRHLYLPDSSADKTEIYLSAQGLWYARGSGSRGCHYVLGKRDAYQDPNF